MVALSGFFIPASLGEPPAKVLDLSRWMLTLPVDTDRRGSPDEIKQPVLASFVDPDRFFVDEQRNGVVFRAHCGGKTTKGSRYPRCELREMNDDGKTRASWETQGSVIHTMTMRVAITKTPRVKKHVVCAQIHDASDDVMMVRLEGKKLFVERNETGDVMLDDAYELGTSFDLKVQAREGRIKVWYDSELKLDWEASRTGCYFKAGCYTQSNLSQNDTADDYGEVVISQLHVGHESQP